LGIAEAAIIERFPDSHSNSRHFPERSPGWI